MAELWRSPADADVLLAKGLIRPDQHPNYFQPEIGAEPPMQDAGGPLPPPYPVEMAAPIPQAEPAPTIDPATQGSWGGYAQAIPSTPTPPRGPTDINYDALGSRDQVMTDAYAQAYGGQTQADFDANQRAAPAQAQPTNAQLVSADGVQLLEPAVPYGQGKQGGLQGQANPYEAQLAEYMRPLEMQQQAINAGIASGESIAAEEAAYHRKMQRDANAEMIKNQQWEQQNREKFEEKGKKLEEYADNIATKKIDPERFWANKATWQKITGALAIGLGSAHASSGGDNPGLSIINQAIQRDVDAQKSEMANAREAYNARAGLYNDQLNMFKDERASKAAAMIHGISIAQMGLQAISARYKGADMKQKGQILNAQLESMKGQYKQAFAQEMQAQIIKASYSSGQSMSFGTIESLPKDQQEKAVGNDQRFYGIASSPGGAQKIREKVPVVEATRSGLRRLIEIGKMPRTDKASPKLRDEVDILLSALKGTLREDLLGPGTVQENERKILDRIFVDPSTLFSLGNESKKLEIMLGRVDARWRDELHANNLWLPEDMRTNKYNEQPVTRTGARK